MPMRGRERDRLAENKLYVGGLPVEIDDAELREMFIQFGDVESTIVMKGQDGRSRSFGFVCFENGEGLDEAMKGRSKVTVRGRSLEIRRAFPRETPSEQQVTSCKLFVGGCRGGVNEDSLREYFSKFGKVISVEIIKGKDGETRGFGFVEFDDWDATDKVILSGEHQVAGRPLEIRKYLNRDQFEKRRTADSEKRGAPPPYLSSSHAYPPSGRQFGNGVNEMERERLVPIWDRLFGLSEEDRARELLLIDEDYFVYERERLERQLRELGRLESERRRVIERMRDRAGPSFRDRSPLIHRHEMDRRGGPEFHPAYEDFGRHQSFGASYEEPSPYESYRSSDRSAYGPVSGGYRR